VFRHPERKGAPSTAELQNVKAVLKLRSLARERKHLFLCSSRLSILPDIAAAILTVLSQSKGEELRRDLIVLNIRSIGEDRDRALAKHADKDTLMLAERRDAATVLLAKASAVQQADAVTDEPVRQDASLSKVISMLMTEERASSTAGGSPRPACGSRPGRSPSRDAERTWMDFSVVVNDKLHIVHEPERVLVNSA